VCKRKRIKNQKEWKNYQKSHKKEQGRAIQIVRKIIHEMNEKYANKWKNNNGRENKLKKLYRQLWKKRMKLDRRNFPYR